MPEFVVEKQNLIIRPMHEEDLQQVCHMENTYFSDAWSYNGFWTALHDEDALFIIVQKGEEIVGYAGVYNGGGDGDICTVAVKECYRNQGIGQIMLETLMEFGTRIGMKNYTLEVRVSNAGAIALYTKLGFEGVGVRPGFYQKPKEDALIMWKYKDHS